VARSRQVEDPPSGTELAGTEASSEAEASGLTPHPAVDLQNALASSEARASVVPGIGVVAVDPEALHPNRPAKSSAKNVAPQPP